MKNLRWVGGMLLALLLLGACAGQQAVPPEEPTAIPLDPLPVAMKGYELYSWPTGEGWAFTLITGTNRNKTYKEVTTGEAQVERDGWVKITVEGEAALKAVLARLPEGTPVFWFGAATPIMGEQAAGHELALPDAAMVDEVEEYCRERGIDLHIAQPDE
ncbi:MAG: hypothetical protein GX552_04515 [Chloroflexi bacterium]|jgi:hypothetical protein|nr:hypothetical protein [Chloroflexota bacterium]